MTVAHRALIRGARVGDHCRAIERVLEGGRMGETYNVGGRNEWTNLAIVRVVCGLLDELFDADPSLARRFPESPAAQARPSASLLTFIPDRPGHDRRYAIEGRRLETELAFRCARFESRIRNTIDWYLADEAWRPPLRDRARFARS